MLKTPVVLNLTPEEARTLSWICFSIGGDPKGTRGLVDNIYGKLNKQNQKFKDAKVNLQTAEGRGEIYFKP